MRKGDTKKERFIEGKKFASENARNLWMETPRALYELAEIYTVVCKIVHKIASVWCKTASGEVGVSLP